MSIVIDQVQEELKKEYSVQRNSPQSLTVFSKGGQSRCEILTKDLNSFNCTIIRGKTPTIGNTYYSSSFIIDWVKKKL